MKIINSLEPIDLAKTHTSVPDWFIVDLERAGVPVYRFVTGSGALSGAYAARWASELVAEWGTTADAFSENILRRIVAFVFRTKDEDFAAACLTVLRLDGRLAVEKMLDERKDLLKR